MVQQGYDILLSYTFQLGASIRWAAGLVGGVGVVRRVADIIVQGKVVRFCKVELS